MILLDTHTWIWFLSNPEFLSETAKIYIDRGIEKSTVSISSISVWELAMLVNRKRIRLSVDLHEWIDTAEKLNFIRFIPVDNSIALKSVTLPGQLHNDPADRIIIATAIEFDALLITKDRKILEYPNVRTAW